MKASHRIVGIVVALALTAGLVAFTFAYDWFGPLVAQEDGKIDSVYRWLAVASIPFFVIILSIIAFCIVEFRYKEGDEDKDGEPLHGSTKIEIVWTVIPTIVVVALGFYAWIVLDDVEARQPNEMNINVIGQQYAWNFEYPDEGKTPDGGSLVKTNGDLIVPLGRPLYFTMTSADVIHSFYIPATRMKRDVADGFTTHINFTPDKLGTYPILCTELCGIGHTTMRSNMRVVTPTAFKAWVASKKTTGNSKTSGAIAGDKPYKSSATNGQAEGK